MSDQEKLIQENGNMRATLNRIADMLDKYNKGVCPIHWEDKLKTVKGQFVTLHEDHCDKCNREYSPRERLQAIDIIISEYRGTK
jgi:hypothetical protein